MDCSKRLKLDDQLCFPMYLLAKEIITTYNDLLEPLDLTYTQYLVMMVIWESKEIDMKSLGEKLFLDSSTLTPVINRLIKKEYLSKRRDERDKRNLIITIEEKGMKLREDASNIPEKIYSLVDLEDKEKQELARVLNKIIKKLKEARK